MQSGTCQPTILTLHDAITDSPVYRANALHFDEQIDLLEKWLEQLSKHLKLYTDKLNKFNLETNNVCKKAIPVGIDSALIDPNFTGAVIRSFSDALQTSLAFKTKLVSDLEDNFIQPLLQFVKTHLKDFKEFRKQHEKALERYEAQLYKYTSQSKSKEASAVREEAFRLHEARKAYVRMSGQHVVRILQFRSLLEHCLVDSFSSATLAHFHDFDGGKQVWAKLDSSLAAWKQWLVDDRSTCDYQLHRLQTARKQLEAEYLQQTQPLRDLDRYGSSAMVPLSNNRHSLDLSSIDDSNNKPTSCNKWGYLYTRVSRMTWTRKFFFLYDGYFGTCLVNPKLKGAITVGERVSVLLCDIKPVTDAADRRFCFEVVCVQQPPFFLQAETENEMREWMAAFARAKRFMLQNEKLHLHTQTTMTNTTNNGTESGSDSDSPQPNTIPIRHSSLPPTVNITSSVADSTISNDSALSFGNNNNHATTKDTNGEPSIVILSTSADHEDEISLDTSTTLTPLLVSEASKAQPIAATNNNSSSVPSSPAAGAQTFASAMASNTNHTTATVASTNAAAAQHQQQQQQQSWGIPWALVPNMFSGGAGVPSSHPEEDPVPSSPLSPAIPSMLASGMDNEGHPIVWPIRSDDAGVPKVELNGYSAELEARNKELRHLFGGVAQNEVVLDAFIGSLKKKPVDDDDLPDEVVSSPTAVDTFDQELKKQLEGSLQNPISKFGYSYTGRAFITQETFWYYSCILMNCVHTVAVRLRDIKSVRLVRDMSMKDTVTKNGPAKNIALAIDLNKGNEPLVITTLLNDVEAVMERLRFAVENAKTDDPLPIQTLYDVIQSMTASTQKSKTTHQMKKSASTTTATEQVSKEAEKTAEIYQPEPAMSPVPESKKKRKGRKSSGASKPVPKSGALAAAMMAATVAGGSGLFDPSRMAYAEDMHKRQHQSSNKESSSDEGNNSPTPSGQPAAKKGSSSGSDDDIPSHIQIPKGPVSCNCDEHMDKIESEVQLPVSAKKLYDYMFGDDITVWESKNTASNGTNLRVDPWVNVEGKQQRTMKYILPVNNPMVKLKEAEVVETQIVQKKEDYIRYVVQISTKTAQLPYADAFVPSIRYCITWVNKSQCKLTCSMGVKFIKSVLVKGMISKAALKGMGESLATFIPILQNETNKLAGNNKTATNDDSEKQSVAPVTNGTNGIPAAANATSFATSKDDDSLLGQATAYFNTAVDFVSELPLSIRGGLAGVVVLWIIFAWLFSGSNKSTNTEMEREFLPRSSSRAVYLRDLENGLLKTDLQPIYAQEESFQLFLENGTTHRWFNVDHHRMAIEFLFSRERVAMLRHDMLVIFNLLNQVDAQLLENEYVNWMLDTRKRCRLTGQPADTCDKIQVQLESFIG